MNRWQKTIDKKQLRDEIICMLSQIEKEKYEMLKNTHCKIKVSGSQKELDEFFENLKAPFKTIFEL